MRRTNILFVITKLELGGAQTQLLRLLAGIDKERYNPILISAKEGLLVDEALGLPGLTLLRSPFLERNINPLRDILALFEIWCAIRKHKAQIVHTHSSKAGILGRFAAFLAGTKSVFHTVHGWSFHDCQPAPARRIFMLLERAAACCSSKIIVVCDRDRQAGIASGIAPEQKFAIVRYGIEHDESFKEAPAIRGSLGIKDNEAVIGTVSCLKPQKSPADFIRVAALVKKKITNARFVLVGDGDLRRQLQALIRKLKLEDTVMLLGWRRDAATIVQAFDIFVLTSLWEGLPVAVLEALAAGKPVVATDTGGVEEVVTEGENGFLVGRKDVIGTSERIIRLLSEPELLRRMSEKARASISSSYQQQEMVSQTEALYALALGQGKSDDR